MENWYAATCKTEHGEQDMAELVLANRSFDVYNPKVSIDVIKRGVRAISVEPVFPGYIFVKFDPSIQSASIINGSRGIRKLITFGNTLVPMAEGVVDELKQRLSSPAFTICDAPTPGDEVEIKKGPFAGLDAAFSEPNGPKRSMLIIEVLGSMRNVHVNNSQFVKR